VLVLVAVVVEVISSSAHFLTIFFPSFLSLKGLYLAARPSRRG
jgi:hypothetical protein